MLHDFGSAYQDIILRPLAGDDIEVLRQTRNSNRSAFLSNSFISPSAQGSWYLRYTTIEDDFMFAAYFADNTDAIVGFSSLYHVDQIQHDAEFGRFLLAAPYRGKGLGSQIVNATCAIGWSFLGLNEIYLEVLESNVAAIKTYLKSGFQVYSKRFYKGNAVILMKAKLDDYSPLNCEARKGLR